MILLVVRQAGTWFSAEGEQRLKDSYTTDDTLVCTETAIQHFEEFLAQAKVLDFGFVLFFSLKRFGSLKKKKKNVIRPFVIPNRCFLFFPKAETI